MVATAEGPPNSPPTFWSKLFIAVMAFISIGTLITSVGTLFGPFLGYAFHKGMRYAEKELNKVERLPRDLTGNLKTVQDVFEIFVKLPSTSLQTSIFARFAAASTLSLILKHTIELRTAPAPKP